MRSYWAIPESHPPTSSQRARPSAAHNGRASGQRFGWEAAVASALQQPRQRGEVGVRLGSAGIIVSDGVEASEEACPWEARASARPPCHSSGWVVSA